MSNDLSRAMRAMTEDLHPNVGKLTSGGIERGVRKRRTRRLTQIAGAAASVTAVFGAVAMVAPGSGSGTRGSGADVSAASSGLVPAAVTTTTASAPAKPSAPRVSGEDMVKWLEQELAPYHFSGVSVENKAGSGDFSGGPYATLKIGYSSSVGSLALNVSRSSWSDQTNGTAPYITVKTLSDGSHLMIFNGPEWPAGNGDPNAKRLDIGWYRTDGALVNVMVLNQAQEKGGVTATGLALTVDQATQLVQAPVWNQAITAVLAAQRPDSVPGGTPNDKAADLKAKKDAGPDGGAPANPAAPPAH